MPKEPDAPSVPDADHAISAKGLRKRFGPIEAVRGIDLRVRPGEVLGFLGPNGAGKSTTMRMLTGFLEPTAGTVAISGIDIARDPIAARRRLGYLPEGAPLYPDMTVGEFLMFIARARSIPRDERQARIDSAVRRTHLAGVYHQSIETLSKGFKRRVGLAQAILHDPEVLVLDEPTDGLDPNQKHQVRQLIRAMAGLPDTSAAGFGASPTAPPVPTGKAIILSTHILEEVEAVCTRAVIIDRGRVVFDGTPTELEAKAPPEVTRARLDHVFRSLTSRDTAEPMPESTTESSASSRKEAAA